MGAIEDMVACDLTDMLFPPTACPMFSVLCSRVRLCIRSITRYGEPVVSWDTKNQRLILTSGCATMADIVDLRTVNGVNVGPVYHFSQVIYSTTALNFVVGKIRRYLIRDVNNFGGTCLSLQTTGSDTSIVLHTFVQHFGFMDS